MWWENVKNEEIEDRREQQRAYVKFMQECPEVLAHLRLIAANPSSDGMTVSESCIAGRARLALLLEIPRNAGVVDPLAIIEAELEIAMKSPVEDRPVAPVVTGFNME